MKKPCIISFGLGIIVTLAIILNIGMIVTSISNIINIQKIASINHSIPREIAPYLYSISFQDYQFDANENTLNNMEAFGCSSARNGDYYGRNFDYIFNDVPEFVVRVAAKKGRHASLGVATHFGLRESGVKNKEYNEQLKLIPNATLDGINDAGVIISDNVVSQDDVEPLTGTNPNGEKLHIAFVPRLVLDRASSADEAVELIKSRNLYGTIANGMYLHFMIADSNKTYIVEIVNNQVVAEEKTNDNQIMTNFYNNTPVITDHAHGLERYNILKKNYPNMNSIEGMRTAFEKVRFSNAYRYSNEPAWNSELLPQSVLAHPESAEYQNMMSRIEALRKDYWNAITNDTRNPANSAFWHTTHNSTYDMKNKTLRLVVQEDYGHHYDFSL